MKRLLATLALSLIAGTSALALTPVQASAAETAAEPPRIMAYCNEYDSLPPRHYGLYNTYWGPYACTECQDEARRLAGWRTWCIGRNDTSAELWIFWAGRLTKASEAPKAATGKLTIQSPGGAGYVLVDPRPGGSAPRSILVTS